MTNLSATKRQKAIRTAAPGWHRRTTGLCVAGAGAALIGMLATPLAQADSGPAYGDLSNMYEAMISFESAVDSGNANGTAFLDTVFFSDLTTGNSLLHATGLGLGDPFHSDATASEDLSAIVAEGTKLSDQLTTLEQGISATGDAPGSTDLPVAAVTQEGNVIAATLAFQQQIDDVVSNLPAITSQEETNPLLIADLSALDENEIYMSDYLVNLGYELAPGSAAGVTGDNADFLAAGLGISIDTQSTGDTLTVLSDLSSIGL